MRTATPSAPTASTGSAEASTIASHDPKISRCATPTFVTTTMSGRAISHSNVTSPLRRAPISATTTSASAAAPSSVTGRPTSLLNDSGLAWVRNRLAHTAAAMSLVEVLPLAPVMPTTRADIVRRSSAASCRNASPGERTNTAGPGARETVAEQRSRRPVVERLRHEQTAVGVLAGQRHEQRARPRGARVGHHRTDLDVGARVQTVDGARDLGHPAGPHASSRIAMSSSRATSRSSKWTVPPASSW